MGGFELIFGIVPIVVIVIVVMATSVRILRDRANAVVNPGGDGSGPGLVLLIPFIDKMVRVSLRTITTDVPPQDVITRDNVSVKVNAVIFFRVLDAAKAVISVQDYLYATSQMAQTTLRSVLGQQELDDLLASREKINQELGPVAPSHCGAAAVPADHARGGVGAQHHDLLPASAGFVHAVAPSLQRCGAAQELKWPGTA